ncbi:hypothetical protein COY90_00475, partial [Candidatus Roizmanbacteria bacterium CG_4_10_14_0_8_um_filter_39_9]
VISGSRWILSAGDGVSQGYTTSVIISDVYRDVNGTITELGGTLDPSTKKVVTTVSWTTPHASSVSSTNLFTRFRSNLVNASTTKIDFEAGVVTGTAVVETTGSSIPNDGEIILGAGGHGNWCSPDLTTTTLDLPKNGVANGVWAIEGKVSAVTGENASGVSYANILVNGSVPSIASIEGTFDGYKTNSVFMDHDYAYISTDTNAKEVAIINLNQLDPFTKKYSESGYFDAPGNDAATSIYVSESVGYVISGSKLYTFDLLSKSGARPQLGSVNLISVGKKVFVQGSYAYVALLNDSTQLQIVQVTNGGRNLSVVGQASLTAEDATDLVVNSTGTRTYIATSLASSSREFFIVDTSVKTGNRPVVGSYDTNGMNPKGVAITTGNRAIIVGSGAEEYQVVNIANETAPVRCGGLQTTTGVNGISALVEADGDAYSYIITGDLYSELKIIIGGPGGQFSTSGTYVSNAFDANSSAAFNRFSATVSQPDQTEIKMQVAAADAVYGSCVGITYTFVGPDPNNPTTSYFTPVGNSISGSIPTFSTGSYINPARCFKYKIFMTTSDITNSPVFEDFTLNYSP